MFPSWNSLSELEAYREALGRIGFWGLIVVGALGLVIAACWGTYNHKVEKRIDKLRAAQGRERDTEITSGLEVSGRLAEQIPITTGFLVPGSGEMPPLPRVGPEHEPPDIPESAKVFFLGDIVAFTSTMPLVIICQGSEDMVFIEQDEGGLLLSAKFFSQDGKVVCEIVKNQFHLNPHNYFRIERTPHTLTVFNDEARMVFEVDYINPRAIRLLGDFYLRNGVRFVIRQDSMSFPGKLFQGGAFQLEGGGKRIVVSL